MEIIPNFVVLEGGDGSGTTTQLNLLKGQFKTSLKPVFYPAFEPTDRPTGKLIRSALKKEVNFDPKTLCYLFAADRHEHLYGKDGIIERAARGEFVVSDRYAISSLVYQGIECGDELPNALNEGFPAPEITLFFDIKPEVALERVKVRCDGSIPLEIYETMDFQKKVYAKYLSVIKTYAASGARVEILDASKPAEVVADMVWSILSELPIFKA